MSDNVLKEYLIKIGFDNDIPSFQKLNGMMEAAERTVTAHSSGMVKRLLEAQTSIVGAFTGISAAILGTVDKVAMADQGYRLLGLRMLMTTESARKMDMVTKALGADLGTITWDPELHQRANVLSGDIDRMTKNLGPGFEGGMKSIRDMRFEFTRLGVGVEFLGMKFVNDLWTKLNPGETGKTLKQWVDWFEGKIPEFSEKLVKYAVPVLKQTWEILKSLGGAVKEFGVLFTHVIGLLSGDQSLKSTKFSFESIAKAIGHVGDWMAKFFVWVTDGEGKLIGFSDSVVQTITRIRDNPKGIWEGLKEETVKVFKYLYGFVETSFSGLLKRLGVWVSSEADIIIARVQKKLEAAAWNLYSELPGWMKILLGPGIANSIPKQYENGIREDEVKLLNGFAGAAAGFQAGGVFGKLPGAITGAIIGGLGMYRFGPTPAGQRNGSEASPLPQATNKDLSAFASGSATRKDLFAAIDASADRYAVSRSLARAVAQQESGVYQERRSPKGAVGVFQLMPDTAKDLGVDPSNALENIDGGVRYLSQLLEKYGGATDKALAAFNGGTGRMDAAKGFSSLPRETREYVPSVLRLQREFEQQAQPGTPQIPSAPSWLMPKSQTEKPAADQWKWLSQSPDEKTGNSDTAKVSPASFQNRDWSPVLATLQRPILPASQVSHSQQSISVDLGGIYITQPNADAQQIQRAVADGVRKGLRDQIGGDLAQLSPAWA